MRKIVNKFLLTLSVAPIDGHVCAKNPYALDSVRNENSSRSNGGKSSGNALTERVFVVHSGVRGKNRALYCFSTVS